MKYEYGFLHHGNQYRRFASLDELKNEVKSHFAASEQRIVERLTTFPENAYKIEFEGCYTQERSYQHFHTYATKYIDEED